MFAAGLALLAGSQVWSGMSANAEGKASEKLHEYNAQVEEREAKSIEQRGAIESRRAAEQASRNISSMEADMGVSGSTGEAGTPLQILSEQSEQYEIDNMMIGFNTAVERNRALSRASSERYYGKMARTAGRNKAIGSYIGAAGTVLTGLGSNQGSGLNKDAQLYQKHMRAAR